MTRGLQTVQRIDVEALHDGEEQRKRDSVTTHTNVIKTASTLPQMLARSTARASLLGKRERKMHVVSQARYVSASPPLNVASAQSELYVDNALKLSFAFREQYTKEHMRNGARNEGARFWEKQPDLWEAACSAQRGDGL